MGIKDSSFSPGRRGNIRFHATFNILYSHGHVIVIAGKLVHQVGTPRSSDSNSSALSTLLGSPHQLQELRAEGLEESTWEVGRACTES